MTTSTALSTIDDDNKKVLQNLGHQVAKLRQDEERLNKELDQIIQELEVVEQNIHLLSRQCNYFLQSREVQILTLKENERKS